MAARHPLARGVPPQILEEANNNRANNSRSIPRQLLDSSLLHVIVRIFSVLELRQIRLKYLSTSMAPQLDFVKANQKKNKVRDVATNTLVTVKSKAPIFHLYFAPAGEATIYG
jgi:hypothetical protein